ncbi:MAG TPA: methyltransferase, partial [Pedococcus sp.]|nr:methyltransferase [Pedococcus sp.]
MTPGSAPARLRYAVSGLGLEPDMRLLEVGGGHGALAALACELLSPGKGFYLGVDRSAVATRAAEERNAAAVAVGLARFVTAPLAGVDPSVWAPFDRAVAVNVNVFWTGAAEAELAALARLLTPDGVLHLVYEPPAAERLEPLRA